jgi:hypothetical protein
MTATWITYETGTLGATVAAPDSTGFASAPSTAVYDNTHVLSGSQSLKITPAASTLAESRTTQGLNTTKLGVTIPFWYTTAKTADESIFRIEDTTGAKIISLGWASNGRLTLVDKSGTGARLWINPTASPPTGQWIVSKLWIQIGGTATTGSAKLAFYNSAGTAISTASGGIDSPFTSSAANLGTVNIDRFWVGRDGTQTAVDARWYDAVGYDPAATDFLPNLGSSPVTASGSINDNQAQIIVNGVGGTGPYTYAISQTSGPTHAATVVDSGASGPAKWLVQKDSTTDCVYSVTVTDSLSASASPVIVTVPHIQSTGGTLQYFDGVNIITL